jgi:S1-C subfamily serine protease
MSSNWTRKSVMLLIAVMLVAFGFFVGTAVVPGAAANLLPNAALPAFQATPVPISFNNSVALTAEEQQLANIYSQVSPSVVSINVSARISGDTTFGDGFSFGSGSGFVIDTQGHIVTNNHVVDGATRIEVNFFDGTIVRGEVVGLDPDSDLAVLRVDVPAERLRPIQFADSDQLVIGQSSIAIGSPFGQRWTMTRGIISALDRTIQGLTRFSIGSVIQTDAAINPGNSGGPLLDLQGRLIGVNSQIVSENRVNSGIGFAIPSNLVRRVAEDLIADGQVNYSYLGISSDPERDVTLALIEQLGLPNNTRGVVVLGVEANGPAAAAGLRNASNPVLVDGEQVPTSVDIITAIDGQPVAGMSELVSYLASNTQPGQTVNLTVLRDGQTVSVPVVLSGRPG